MKGMELRYIFLFVAALLFGIVHCQLDDVVHMFKSQNSKKIYCGAHLSKTLSAVCKGNYNTLTKKSDIYQTDWSSRDMQSDMAYPYKSEASAKSLIRNFHRRKRRGVFNECCEKPCSHEELSSYCGSPTDRRKR